MTAPRATLMVFFNCDCMQKKMLTPYQMVGYSVRRLTHPCDNTRTIQKSHIDKLNHHESCVTNIATSRRINYCRAVYNSSPSWQTRGTQSSILRERQCRGNADVSMAWCHRVDWRVQKLVQRISARDIAQSLTLIIPRTYHFTIPTRLKDDKRVQYVTRSKFTKTV